MTSRMTSGAKRWIVAGLMAVAFASHAVAEDETAEREARWKDVASNIFGERPMEDGSSMLKLIVPERAMDAALVPVTVELNGDHHIVAVSVVVDNNPSPLAGTFRFGPAFAQNTLKMRVRVNEYTNVRAVGETQDGRLLMTEAYVKAAGGCSAPAVKDPQEAMARLGRIKVKLPVTLTPGSAATAQVMISHPNSSGLQFDQVSRTYIPAHYVQSIAIRVGRQTVLEADTDISISEDPNLRFSFVPIEGGSLEVVAHDTKGATFSRTVPLVAGSAKDEPAL